MNTESCDFYNKYLWGQLSDPNDQLAYLEKELDNLEKQNGVAVLLGHIPDECNHEF